MRSTQSQSFVKKMIYNIDRINDNVCQQREGQATRR